MMSSARTAMLVAVPIAAGVAWLTTRLAAESRPETAAPAERDVMDRIQKLERMLESLRGPSSRDDRNLLRRVEALEAFVEGKDVTTPAARTGWLVERPTEPVAATADEKARQQILVALTTEPAAAEHRTAVAGLVDRLVSSAGPPADTKEFVWAAGLLGREAGRDRITSQEAQDLAPILAKLPAGHSARPALAKAVAIGWSRDDRLGPFLGQFPANAEASLHQGVLNVLDDEHPSPAFSEYVTRIVREERDPGVLATALGLDRIEAAATAVAAPRLAEAIEVRILDGSLDAKMRRLAGLALSVASLRIPESGVASLRRVADRDTDSKVAEQFRQAASALQRGDATLKSLERLFE